MLVSVPHLAVRCAEENESNKIMQILPKEVKEFMAALPKISEENMLPIASTLTFGSITVFAFVINDISK